jgi:drug/metabolite transporter (DMT)-like permease
MSAALRGILWMGGALLSFSAMAVAVRELVDTMGAFQILFFRSAVTLAMVLAVLPHFGLGVLRTGLLGIHTLRNLMHFCGQWLWIYAIAALPLATVFAIEFTMPVWTALLAMLVLGERLRRGRLVMLACGVAGILIILRPGFVAVEIAAFAMLLGSLAYAATNIATKRLSRNDTPLAVLFYMSVIQMPFGLVPALGQWVAPVLADLPWILLVGGAGFSAHYCLTRSFRTGKAFLAFSAPGRTKEYSEQCAPCERERYRRSDVEKCFYRPHTPRSSSLRPARMV